MDSARIEDDSAKSEVESAICVIFGKFCVDCLLKDKKIWQCGEIYRSYQGQYPVIFLTFKDVKFDSWEATLDKIGSLLQAKFGRHRELLQSDRIADYEKTYFEKILNKTATEVDLASALEHLSAMLTEHYKKASVIIIDEYDTPIHEGYAQNFYDEIISFMHGKRRRTFLTYS